MNVNAPRFWFKGLTTKGLNVILGKARTSKISCSTCTKRVTTKVMIEKSKE